MFLLPIEKLRCGEAEDWKDTINEMDSLYTKLHGGIGKTSGRKEEIGCKWVFIKKDNLFSQGVRYRVD